MRLVTLRASDGSTRAGRLDGERVTVLPFADVGHLLALEDRWEREAAGAGVEELSVDEVVLAPVVPSPSKIVCVGLNYRSHIQEMGRDKPEFPTLFAKFSEALIGPRDPIVLPSLGRSPDWEAELAVVIGRRTRHADRDGAAAAIAGFTICNDITMRDWQRRTPQWLQGKTWEATTPLGPALVTPDEVGGPSPDLELELDVNGSRMQRASTSDLVFDPPALVAYVSAIVSLQPGDVISTGTPGGVGEARQPPVCLAPGQVVRTAISGLGELVNECVEESR